MDIKSTAKSVETMFDSFSQVLDIDPEKIKPLFDRVLIRDIPDEEKQGSIFIPENLRDINAGLRQGIVVAIGDGDKWLDVRFDSKRMEAIRKPLKGIERLPMEVKVGDRIVYDRRREAELYINGERFGLLNEQQSVLGVLEP